MNTTNHLSMTNLLKTIREEKLEQFYNKEQNYNAQRKD